MELIPPLIYAFEPYLQRFFKAFPEIGTAAKYFSRVISKSPIEVAAYCPFKSQEIEKVGGHSFIRCANPQAAECACSHRWSSSRKGDKKHPLYWDCKL